MVESRTHEEGASEVEIRRTPEVGENDLTVNVSDTVPNDRWTDDNPLEVILDQTPSEAESLVSRWIDGIGRASHPTEADKLVKEYANGTTSWLECKVDLVKLVPMRVKKRRVREQTIMNRRENRNTAKYRKFRYLQCQYGRQHKMTINRIIKGTFPYENVPEEYPTVASIESVYVGRLEKESRSDESAVNPTEPINVGYGLITKEEIELVRKSMDKDTAPGPDGMKMAVVDGIDISHLQIIFNMWWWQGIPMMRKSAEQHYCTRLEIESWSTIGDPLQSGIYYYACMPKCGMGDCERTSNLMKDRKRSSLWTDATKT